MRRREFMRFLGGAAAAWPLPARAQKTEHIPKIGVLWHAANEQEEESYLNALRKGLRDLGYVEGHNSKIASLMNNTSDSMLRRPNSLLSKFMF